MTSPDTVAKVVDLNGGDLVGRTRLQKTVYFLEKCGVGFGFDFEYHHYGPYSEDLTIAIQDAVVLGLVKQEKHVGLRAQPYSVFRSLIFRSDKDEMDEARQNILGILKKYDAISLELAATADFLDSAGYGEDAWSETALRKSSKAIPDRIEKAKTLLSELG